MLHPTSYSEEASPRQENLEVLYEDNHLIAVFKPSGVLTQGDKTKDPSLLDMTKAYLKEKYKKSGNVYLGLLHRLDRPVSGVVLFAKTSKAASRLSADFRERRVKKTYLARVEGILEGGPTPLTHFIQKSGKEGVRVYEVLAPKRMRAELTFSCIEVNRESSLLRVEPLTGRKHQIRAQLSFIGHPIVGDIRYGAKERRRGISLLSRSIEFSHPISKSMVRVEVPDSHEF